MSADSRTDPRWLDTADALARRLVAAAAPIRFAAASARHEIEAAYRLRHDVVVDEGWIADGEAEMETDEFDNRAIHVVALDGETAAGTVRLVIPAPGLPLPVEVSHGLVVEPRGEVAGAGRLVVARPYRDGTHRVLGGLAATLWLLMREMGYCWIAGTATAEMIGLFEHLGFEIAVLGDPDEYWGELRYPVRMGAPDPEAWAQHGSGRPTVDT